MPPTPQFAWPLLKQRTGVDVVIKHENHTPTGAFVMVAENFNSFGQAIINKLVAEIAMAPVRRHSALP